MIHELYRHAITKEGREVAKLKVTDVKQGFEVIPVDDQIAQVSADLRHKCPWETAMIAATVIILKAVCITDDPHFKQIKEIETAWI